MAEVAQIPATAKEDLAAQKLVPTSMDGAMKSLLSGQWHLIVHKSLGNQLFDWTHDPGESTNLIFSPAGQAAAASLSSQMRDLLARSSPGVSGELRLSAVALRHGAPLAPAEKAPTSSPKTAGDYYRLETDAGSILRIEVSAQKPASAGLFDPVVEIQGTAGEPLTACRNPGDDRLNPPGTSDLTPEAFDDACLNDDISPGTNLDSRLELLVPGAAGSRVQLYVRVSDWDGRGRTGASYHIALTGGEAVPGSRARVQ
jgi:hypothetical protein